jgi:hypothetical protein
VASARNLRSIAMLSAGCKLTTSALGSKTCARCKSDPWAAVMKRFRSHAVIVAVIVVCVVLILLSHSIRLRLEWGTGGFVLGLIAAGIVALDVRHHRKRRET